MRYILVRNDNFRGICFNHKSPINTNGRIERCKNRFVKINGVPISTQGDGCLSFCGHRGKVISSSRFIKINGVPICLIGDFVYGTGIFGRFYNSQNTFVKSI